MESLNCQERRCQFNRQNYCTKQEIAINQNATCLSFQPGGNRDFNTEVSYDLTAGSVMPSVYCGDTECAHNDGHKGCAAKRLSVGQVARHRASCQTFRPR